MSETTTRIRFAKAMAVFETFPNLSENVVPPAGEVGSLDYALMLANGPEPLSALTYFAHALPKREAVWWAMQCVRGLGATGAEREREVLRLSETWVRDSDEEARLAVQDASQASAKDAAATWIGRAASWSGGSLSPHAGHRVPAPEDLTAKALGVALALLVGELPPARRKEAILSCLQAGRSFAEGGGMPVVTLPDHMLANRR